MFFSLGKSASIGEGKLWIQTCSTPLKNWPCVISYPSGGVGKYGHEERDTILTMLTPSQRTAHLVAEIWKTQLFDSMAISPTEWQRTQFSMPQWQRTQFSMPQWQRTQSSMPQWQRTQLSFAMVQCQLSTDSFTKSSNSQDHLFRAWRHPHSSLISCLGGYYDNGDCHILCTRV